MLFKKRVLINNIECGEVKGIARWFTLVRELLFYMLHTYILK